LNFGDTQQQNFRYDSAGKILPHFVVWNELEHRIQMSIWEFSTRLTHRLLVWSVLSLLVAALMLFSSNPFLRGLGIQFLVWGVIDAAIAYFGAKASEKKRTRLGKPDSIEAEAKESRWLERILLVNTGLDILYVLGGVWLMQTWGADSLMWKGHGAGIIIQGGFLFFFDFFHAFALQNLKVH